jgi:hypothetical protein
MFRTNIFYCFRVPGSGSLLSVFLRTQKMFFRLCCQSLSPAQFSFSFCLVPVFVLLPVLPISTQFPVSLVFLLLFYLLPVPAKLYFLVFSLFSTLTLLLCFLFLRSILLNFGHSECCFRVLSFVS